MSLPLAHYCHTMDLSGLSNLGSVDLSHLGSVDLSNLGSVDLSNLGSVDLSHLGSVSLSVSGFVLRGLVVVRSLGDDASLGCVTLCGLV